MFSKGNNGFRSIELLFNALQAAAWVSLNSGLDLQFKKISYCCINCS